VSWSFDTTKYLPDTMNATDCYAADPLQCFSHIPFNQRWEYLKPVIGQYYVGQDLKLSDLARTMKELYKFDAS
jgi:hypothetical protein